MVVQPPKPINCPACGKPSQFREGPIHMVINEKNNKCTHCGAVIIPVTTYRL